MKIAYAFHDGPFFCGGPWVNAMRLLPEFARRGHEVHAMILNHGSKSPAAPILHAQGIHCHVYNRHPLTKRRIKWILQRINKIQPDVFVSNVSIAGGYASHWLKPAGIPTIAAHVSEDDRNWGIAETFGCGDPEWTTSGVFCISQELHSKFLQKNPVVPSQVICHGSPIPDTIADQEKVTRLVYSGRLDHHQKRTIDMMIAVGRNLKKYPHLKFRVIGDGPERKQAEAYIKSEGLQSQVEFTGACSPDEVYNKLTDAQIGILLSDYEGLPGAVIDMAICGLVPLCHHVPGGIHELVHQKKTGILVDNRDNDFDDWLEKLITDHQLRQQLATNARQHMIDHYSLTSCADDWEAFFRTLIAEAGPRKPLEIPEKFELPEPHPKFTVADDMRRYSLALTTDNILFHMGLLIRRVFKIQANESLVALLKKRLGATRP